MKNEQKKIKARKTPKESRESQASPKRRSTKPERDKPKTAVDGSNVRTVGRVAEADGSRKENTEEARASGIGDVGRRLGLETNPQGGERGNSGDQGNGGSDRGESAGTFGDFGTGEEANYDPSFARPHEITQTVEYAVHLPVYHQKQKLFVEAEQKRKMVRAGRRGGKTTGCAGLAVERFLGPPGTNRVLYAVPTADQISRFWHEVVLALAEPIEYGVYRKYESDKIIELPGTDQRIRAKTAWNANTLRGDYGDLIILDEFQLMAEDALDDVVLPMLMDNNGDLVLIYTPPSLHTRAMSKATDKRHAAKMFKKNEKDPRWLCVHFTSHDNPYISEAGIAEVSADMTQLAIRQEIMAEDIDEVPGALWKQANIDADRVEKHPQLIRIVVGVDPSGGSTTEVGIVAAGMGTDGHGYVLSDKSLAAPSPKQWAAEVTWLYYDLKADRILGEENYGGQMVETTIKMHDENISYEAVNATRGKLVRAEPICALYEKHVIHHVGTFAKLEEEMCSYVPGEKSPNRMDALVWCLTKLFPERVRLTLAQSINEESEKAVEKIQKSTLQKPVVTDQTTKCSECGSTAIVKRGPLFHCNSCGREWGTAVMPAAKGGRPGMMK